MTDIFRSRNFCLLFGKIGITLYILYSRWYSETYGNNRFFLYGTVLFASIFVLIDIFQRGGKLQFPKNRSNFILMLIIFFVYCFITGIFVSRDRSVFFSGMQTFLSVIVVCFDVWYISEREQSYDWLITAIFIVALTCAVQASVFGVAKVTRRYTRVALSADSNTNHLGFTMVAGLGALIAKGKSSDKGFLIRLLVSLLFLYVIVLSASRKSLLAGGMFFILWIILYLRGSEFNTQNRIRLVNYVVIALGVSAVIYYLINFFSGTSAYTRMVQLVTEGDENIRVQMYKDAIEFWKERPIFGIGFQQYRVWSQYNTFSHSSYAEVLACTGTIGMLIFFVPIIKLTIHMINRSVKMKYKPEWFNYRVCLVMMFVEYFVGIGQIFIYDTLHLLILTYIFGQTGLLDYKTEEKSES